MPQKHKLRKVILCLGLEIAALMGANVRPEEIEDLLRTARQARIECGSRDSSGDSDDVTD